MKYGRNPMGHPVIKPAFSFTSCLLEAGSRTTLTVLEPPALDRVAVWKQSRVMMLNPIPLHYLQGGNTATQRKWTQD